MDQFVLANKKWRGKIKNMGMEYLRELYLERMDWEVAVYPDFRTPEEIEEIVVMFRLELYNLELPCGPKAIRRRLEHEMIRPLPSERTIARMLARNGLTYGRTGWYEGDEPKDIPLKSRYPDPNWLFKKNSCRTPTIRSRDD